MTAVFSPANSMLLPGAQHVQTPHFQAAQVLAAQATQRGVVAGFFGDAGLGKTHALRWYVQNAGVPYAWITSSPSPGAKEIFEELLAELTGTVPRGTTRELRRACLDELRDRQLIVVVDEAQHLSQLWLNQLRTLHDDPHALWALFLIGGVGCERRLQKDPQLWSRVALHIEFEPLTGEQLHTFLRAYHPVLGRTTADVLDEIDRRHCYGNLRNWVMFLGAALPLAKGSGGITPKIAATVFAMRGQTEASR